MSETVQDAAAIAGAALVTIGVGMIFLPAALIAAGAFLLVGSWLTARKAAA